MPADGYSNKRNNKASRKNKKADVHLNSEELSYLYNTTQGTSMGRSKVKSKTFYGKLYTTGNT